MKTIAMDATFISDYANGGQAKEQRFTYTLTGLRIKAGNVPHDQGADVLHYQVKSARATICMGTDLMAYLATDKATEYAYVANDGFAYIMSREEYVEFINIFGTIDRESSKRGGRAKIRLRCESRAMMAYLKARV